MNDTVELIKKQLAEHPVLLYMKGTPAAPQCGFSAQTVEVLVECQTRFAFVDVLAHPDIRAALPGYAQWPTFPQLWVGGELVGGCDIISGMHERGELKPLLTEHAPGDESHG